MSNDNEGVLDADNEGTLRPFLLAAMLVLSGLTLMEWDNRQQDSDAPLLRISQAR
jgi:hypothetical protein